MTNLKSEKGSITLFVIVSVMLIISFLISTHLILANKVKNQKEIIAQTRKIYESDKSADEIYNEFFSKDGINPIYTVEQLLAVGSGENILVNGKMYKFSDDTSYVLMNDLIFDVDNYEEFLGEDTDWEPIDEETIDIIWNGHTITATHLNDLTKMYGAHAPLLPLEFTQIEYIESTGTQYIDTDYIPRNNTKIDIKYERASEAQTEAIFGVNWSLNGFFLMHYQGNVRWHGKTNAYDISESTLGNIREISVYQTDISINGVDYNNVVNVNDTQTNTLRIFGVRGDNTASQPRGKLKIYELVAYEYDENTNTFITMCDFIPCIRNIDNKPGLYDIVNDEFYTNQGTGEFSYGSYD